MAYRSIRGAITVENNNKEEILLASKNMLQVIIKENSLEIEDIISILFTMTKDLTKIYPAVSARELGITEASLMCIAELFIENSLEKCIRVQVNIDSQKKQKDMKHIYLEEAVKLRPDLAKNKNFSIAIDGPNGSGKSTIARLVASELGFIYIDTGAFYRSVGYYCLKNNIDINSRIEVLKVLDKITIRVKYSKDNQRIFLNAEDVTEKIRVQKYSDAASRVAIIFEVREKLVTIQQNMALNENVVMDGRDISTKVLPQASLKIYLDASLDERAKRRYEELKSKEIETNFETTRKDLEERDYRDMTRGNSPLVEALDAIVIDSTNLNAEEVKIKIINLFKEVKNKN